MRMLFTGCVQCGRSTTSVEGLCPTCDDRIATPTPSKERVQVQRERAARNTRNS